MTRVMSGVGGALPLRAWRSPTMLKAMGVARLDDFWIPQRGIFAMGRVFVETQLPLTSAPTTSR